MMEGISVVSPNSTLGDIGSAIQVYAENQNYSVVRDFCGHGLGKIFHEHPNILHYGNVGEGEKIEEGMFFTVEPMINVGKYDIRMLPDGWTAVTKDKTLSAQFEHSIAVTSDGYEIFTKSPAGLDKP
jgi:methionyl aminopeptidase